MKRMKGCPCGQEQYLEEMKGARGLADCNPIIDLKLAINTLDLGTHRCDRDDELLRNLRCGGTGRQQTQHAYFLWTQWFQEWRSWEISPDRSKCL